MPFNWYRCAVGSTENTDSPQQKEAPSALPANTADGRLREDAVSLPSNTAHHNPEAASQSSHPDENIGSVERSRNHAHLHGADGLPAEERVQDLPQSVFAPSVEERASDNPEITKESSDTNIQGPAPTQQGAEARKLSVHEMSKAGLAKALDGWKTLVKTQSDVVAGRIAARESTNALLNNVKTFTELALAFMGQIDPFLRDHDDLRTTFERLQVAQNELQSEQVEVFRMHELIIIQSESRLIELESRVYPSGPRSPAESVREGLVFSDVNQESTPSVVSSRNIRADPSPEADRLLSQIGEVDLLRERLENMEIEYERVIEKKELQEVIGQDLDIPSRLFLQDFDNEHLNLILRLKDAENLENELRQAVPGMKTVAPPPVIFDAGPDSNSLPGGTQSVTGEEQYVEDDITHAQAIVDPTYRAAAELFYRSEEEQKPVYSNVKTSPDGKQVDKPSYINAWLLHQVQTVPTAMERLARVYKAQGVEFDPADREDLLLTHWTSADIEHLAKKEKPSVKSPHASVLTTDGHASVKTNDGRNPTSKAPSDSHVPVDGRKSPLELRPGTRPPLVGA